MMLLCPINDDAILTIAAKLPTAPRLLVELGQLMNDPRADVDEVVALLKQDPPLIAQILRMANSAAYAPAQKIAYLEQALAMIGFAEVHRLVGVVAAQQLTEQRMRFYPIDGTQLRLNTLFVAVLMEELAKFAHESPRRCYTVGLLRPMGMMALERWAATQPDIVPFADSGHSRIGDWELEQFGLTNVEVAEKILLHWKLPHETVIAIRHHYDPGVRHNPIIHLLMLAATGAAERFSGIPGEMPYWTPGPSNLTRAGLGPKRLLMASERAQRKYEQLRIAVG